MTAEFDVIVLGAGGVGSAAAYHCARRGLRTLALDRFPAGHDRGSSHGHTRIIRQAYFEHPDYVPLVLGAYQLWADLEAETGRRLYHQTGLVQIGPQGGEVLTGLRASSQQHDLQLEPLTGGEVEQRFAGFRVPPDCAGLYEEQAGYLLVEDCVRAHLEQAEHHGATLQLEEAATDWSAEGNHVAVQTERNVYRAAKLIIAAGAWAGRLLPSLAMQLEVRRKPQFWFQTESDVYHAQRGSPACLYELPEGIFYSFPQIDERGVKMACHSGGQVVADPLNVNRTLDPQDLAVIQQFAKSWRPGVTQNVSHHSVCMYTVSPDQHFILDRHPQHPQVLLACGLSGHGFKFTPALGLTLAEMAEDQEPSMPIQFLSLSRESLGKVW